MLNCLDGYLTPECANCADWADGSDLSRGIGCCSTVPIMWCPHYAKAVEEEEKKRNVDL